jgi:hypothetical protein
METSNVDERGHTVLPQARYRHHAPTDEQIAGMNAVREAAQHMEDVIRKYTVTCRGQSLAFTALEEATMWANKAVLLGDETNLVSR